MIYLRLVLSLNKIIIMLWAKRIVFLTPIVPNKPTKPRTPFQIVLGHTGKNNCIVHSKK